MKAILSILFIVQFSAVLSAQIVNTFVGTADSIGSIDGSAEATFNNPHGIAISQNGTIYICDRFNHIIRRISSTGQVSTLAGQPGVMGDADGQGTDARFHEPWGICVDQNDNVFVADTRNDKIRRITPDGMVSTFAGTGNFGSTDGVLDNCTFGQPVGIETDGNGNFYVADHGTHIIRKISADGLVTTLAGAAYETGDVDGLGPAARFNKPYGLTLDLEGNIILADEWNHKIRKITPDGMVSTIAGLGVPGGIDGNETVATFNFPWDISVDSNGFIYVADGINFAIRRIDANGNMETSTYAGKIGASGYVDGVGGDVRFNGATGLAISPLTRELYVCDAFNQVIRKITDPQQGVFLMAEENLSGYCPNETVLFNAFPDVFDQFQFYVDNELVSTSSGSQFEAAGLSPGFHTIKVVSEFDAVEMTSEELSFEVFTVEQATIDTIGSTTFFEGDSVILVASFGFDYFWSNGAETPTLTVKEPGNYSVQVTDANNCISTTSVVEVTVQSDPDAIFIEVDGPTTICEGESLSLFSSQSENVQWFKDGWPIDGANTMLYEVTEPGNYQVQYTDVTGVVVISDLVEINYLPALELDFEANKTAVRQNEEVRFSILNENISNVEWDFGDIGNLGSSSMEPVYQYTEIGFYDVTVYGVDDRGCSGSNTKINFIRVFSETETEPQDDVFIASAFTPNGDGNNDFLMVRGSDVVNMLFKVFSDKGNLMFESDSQNFGWDGMHKNQKAPLGNYIYQLNYTDLQGNDKNIIGKTTLLK